MGENRPSVPSLPKTFFFFFFFSENMASEIVPSNNFTMSLVRVKKTLLRLDICTTARV